MSTKAARKLKSEDVVKHDGDTYEVLTSPVLREDGKLYVDVRLKNGKIYIKYDPGDKVEVVDSAD